MDAMPRDGFVHSPSFYFGLNCCLTQILTDGHTDTWTDGQTHLKITKSLTKEGKTAEIVDLSLEKHGVFENSKLQN